MATKKKQSKVEANRQRVVDSLLKMEPELQLLRGSIQILRALGETADSVEPIALAALAHCCDSALQEVDQIWRACLAPR